MAELPPSSQNPPPITNHTPASVNATINSTGIGDDTATSHFNNSTTETSSLPYDKEAEKALQYAEELIEKGSKASKEEDYSEATDCFSRALEIRVAHYGELAPECVRAYYKYGCALLYKAQEESDPLVSGAVSKKEVNDSTKESGKCAESVETSVSSDAKEGTSDPQGESEGGGEEEDDEASDAEEEDESDLDLAWKMLDVARAIAEKQLGDTMEKVDILSALAEVALEREDVETSLNDYLKALSMLERLAEPDSRHIAELNFRICLCLEIGSKGEEAIPYCQKAISVCKSRLQRLTSEIRSSHVSMACTKPESAGHLSRQSSSVSQTTDPLADKEKEIEILNGLSTELEKKLEDLQQVVSNPSSILSDIMGMMAAKGKGGGGSSGGMASSSAFGFSSVSTASANGDSGVTHLGVVGRGVKRVTVNSIEPPAKKSASDPAADNGGSA